MNVHGANPAQSLAGIANAERLAARDVDRARADEARMRARRRQDQVELSGGAEAIEAVRNLKDPTQEESKDERDARPQYSPPGSDQAPPRLDVRG